MTEVEFIERLKHSGRVTAIISYDRAMRLCDELHDLGVPEDYIAVFVAKRELLINETLLIKYKNPHKIARIYPKSLKLAV